MLIDEIYLQFLRRGDGDADNVVSVLYVPGTSDFVAGGALLSSSGGFRMLGGFGGVALVELCVVLKRYVVYML